jgi:peptidoglycan hydrolase-like protein with peptidoglycan-binding domain
MKTGSIVKTSWLRRSLFAAALFAVPLQLVSAECGSLDNPVALVQEALKLKHFYYGDVNGSFDLATQCALRRFQFRYGLPGTGEMDDATVETLTGVPSSRKAASANIAAQPERRPEIARPIEKQANRAALSALPNAAQKPAFSVSLELKEQGFVSHAAYTERVQSWAAQHRAPLEDRVEVRRAIPISSQETADRAEIYHEVVTTVPTYFSGQDGHVYTYYRKIRTMVPDVSDPPTSPYGAGQPKVSFPLEMSDWVEKRGGSVANR